MDSQHRNRTHDRGLSMQWSLTPRRPAAGTARMIHLPNVRSSQDVHCKLDPKVRDQGPLSGADRSDQTGATPGTALHHATSRPGAGSSCFRSPAPLRHRQERLKLTWIGATTATNSRHHHELTRRSRNWAGEANPPWSSERDTPQTACIHGENHSQRRGPRCGGGRCCGALAMRRLGGHGPATPAARAVMPPPGVDPDAHGRGPVRPAFPSTPHYPGG
jgi:hypothetical protein